MLNSKPVGVSLFLAGLTLLAFPWTSDAQQAEAKVASGQYKIGVVNVKEVFDSYEKQKNEYRKLEGAKEERQRELDRLFEKIEAAQKRHTEEKDTLSEADLEALEERILSDASLHRAEFKRLQDEIDRKEKKLLESLFQEIDQAISEVGAQGNYHLVLEAGRTGRSGVLYFSTPLNMTQQIIDYLNTKYKKT